MSGRGLITTTGLEVNVLCQVVVGQLVYVTRRSATVLQSVDSVENSLRWAFPFPLLSVCKSLATCQTVSRWLSIILELLRLISAPKLLFIVLSCSCA
jgi:hypothetical protein